VTDLAAVADDLRPLMFSIAYRMLGSVAEAEDVVQDAFIRLHNTDLATVVKPEAFATTVTTRVAIDALRSARLRREQYVGPWLPEPLVPDRDTDPSHRVELDDSVSTAMLVLLEQLTPVERAVFILREALGYGYADIAAVVEKSEANCRQLFARARARLDEGRPRFETSPTQRDTLVQAFLAAVATGDLVALEQVLAEDVVFYGDGGGKAPSIRTPKRGALGVARFLLGLARRGQQLDARPEVATANGEPAVLTLGPDGSLLGVLTIEVSGDRVVGLRNQINPDKLQHLGQVGDLTALMQG
jgi:RNA polymerase sigma-70 factor (TIGR02957 family)